MIRRLNFTGRKRVSKAHVTVNLHEEGKSRFLVAVGLDLSEYQLPAPSRVFVEAYRQTRWQRFDFGTVGAPLFAEGARPLLKGFGSAQGVRFRLRVVEPATALLLALCDDVRPVREPGKKGGRSLLPVDWGELRHHTHKLEIDDETGPLLLVSRVLVPDRDAFVGSREFVSLALPEILRRILERAVLAAGDEDSEGWAVDWLRLAGRWNGSAPPSGHAEADSLTDDEEDWIDAAIEGFSRERDIPKRFAEWWEAQ